ncbi:MAG: coiled-coil domain-containing protein [Candidatus Hermodarchaeota archaeon]
MVEKNLEEFEEFYADKVNSIYSKIKRALKKIIIEIRDNLIEIKVCLDHFLEVGKEKIDQKSQKSLNFFSDRIRKEIDEIVIPEDEITYDNTLDLLNAIKKLFTSINEIARKSLPKFQKEVQPQIKELNYITRKLGKNQGDLDLFLRKKYIEVKDAEYLLKKLPKIFALKDNIEHAKADLEQFERELEERNKKQEELNSQLIKLEQNQLFKELEVEQDKLFRLQIKINEEIGFKKALKKFKFELEKETIHIPNVDMNYLRDFLKNPIKLLSTERKDLPKFTSLMVQLRHALQENRLNLKSDTKEKTIDHINMIFDEKILQTNLEKYMQLKENIKSLEDKIKSAGLADHLEELKNEISVNTVKLEHVTNDYERKNKDYTRYLNALKDEREEFQTQAEEILGEKVKLNIVFTF